LVARRCILLWSSSSCTRTKQTVPRIQWEKHNEIWVSQGAFLNSSKYLVGRKDILCMCTAFLSLVYSSGVLDEGHERAKWRSYHQNKCLTADDLHFLLTAPKWARAQRRGIFVYIYMWCPIVDLQIGPPMPSGTVKRFLPGGHQCTEHTRRSLSSWDCR